MATGGRRGMRLAIVLTLIAGTLGAVQSGPLAAAQVVPLGGGAESPTAVVAQGVATLPDDVAWRVVRAEAGPREDQQPVTAATGFIVAGSGSLVLSDLDGAGQELLASGEAVWVAGESEQQRASLTDDAVTYTELSLVDGAAADDAGAGDLVFAGRPFDAPEDARDIDLTMAMMAPGQTVRIEPRNGESIVFVPAGTVSVSSGGDLATGDAQAYGDDVTLTNETDDDATVMFATIGDVVPPLATVTGSATLQVRACPDGSTGSSFVPRTCEPVDASDGFGVNLLDASFTPLRDDGELTDGEQTWDDLEFGTYPWGAPTLPAPYVGTLWTDTESVPLDSAEVTITARQRDVTHILYVFPVTTGAITVTIANCPAGVTPQTLADAFCGEPVAASSGVTVTTPGGELLDATDAVVGGGSYRFDDLPVANDGGVYVIDQPILPSGFVEYLIVSGGSGDLNAAAGVALTPANPFADVTVFNFQPAPIPTATPAPLPTVAATVSAPTPIPTSIPPPVNPTPTASGALAPPPDAPVSAAAVSGSITLQVIGCPPGVERGDSASYGACLNPVGGGSVVAMTPDGQALTSGGSGGVYAFDGLAFGVYSVGLTGLPAGFSGAVAPGYDTSAGSAARVNVSVSADASDPVVTVYVFQ